jgi:PAS domain S-box-containing protein
MATLRETRLRDLPPATPLTLGLWTTAVQAADILCTAGAAEALVLDGGRPLGVVTARGILRVLVRDPDKAAHLAVRDFMDPVAVSQETDALPAALRHLLAAPSRRLAVVDATGRAVGLLTPFWVARLGHGVDGLSGRTVASAMVRTVVTAMAGEPLPLVLGRMVRAGVGGVVVAEADRPRGLLTAADAVALLAGGRDIRQCPVEAAMRAPVEAVSPQLPLAEAVRGLDGAGAGRLVVTDPAGFLLGILTATDVATAVNLLWAEAETARLGAEAARYRDLYDQAMQGLFRLDPDGRPLAVNTPLARLLGYRDVADCLRQAGQASHPLRLDAPGRRDVLLAALARPDAVAFEVGSYRPDGSVTRLRCVLRCVRDARGCPVALEGACADFPAALPDGRPVREIEYRSIVEHQTELICRRDAAGRLTFVNPAFARYWSRTPEACVEEDFRPGIPEDDAAVVARRVAALCPARPTTGFEHRVVRADGRIRWQRWTCRAFFDACGVVAEYQFVGRDVTARKLAEKRLETQAGHALAMLEALPLPVFHKGRDGRYTGCNQAFETLLGLPRARIVGQTLGDLCGTDNASPYEALESELLARGNRQVYEARLALPAGWRSMAIHKAVVRDAGAGGEATGIIGVALDVTERRMAEAAATKVRDGLEAETARLGAALDLARTRLAEEARERQGVEERLRREVRFLETVLASIQEGVCVLSPDLTVVTVNRAMRALYMDNAEPVGRKCHEVYQGLGMPCQDCPSLRAMASGKLAMSLVRRCGPGGETGWLELFCFPLFDDGGAVAGVVEIVRDVTAGKKLEAELAAALERAEAGSLAKGAFLANMSHEIRTPLNAVLGYVQLMLRDRLEPRQRERLAVVEESAATLLSLINDILDYSKIEAGRMELKKESFDLPACLDAVVKEQEVLARNKGLDLTLAVGPEVPRHVRGDGLRLRQVLRNLLSNAVKYTEAGSVAVRVDRTGELPGPAGEAPLQVLRFAVADTGVGIPEERQAAIFDSFTQVDDGLTRRQAGTGLGLAICRRLAGLMGGGVFVESVPGRGSVFWLECPFEVAEPAASAAAPARGHPAGPACRFRSEALPRLRILLVEDNRVNRVFAGDLLESRGHEVVMAENGRAALDVLARERVDVVLMDIQMPVMDGLAATRAIRAGTVGIDPALPVIGLSAYAMDQERERFLAAGLDGYITKPIDVEAFFEVVRTVLARRGGMAAGVSRAVPPPGPAVLDTQGLFSQYGAKAGLLAKVGREFVSSVPEQLEVLGAAVRDRDLAVCERVAHTLKGNAAMFGAMAMRALAAEAEVAAASGDADLVERLAPPLCDACRTAVRHMDDFLGRLGT